MLPFLQPKKQAAVIIAKRIPSGDIQASHEEGEYEPGLMSAAEDLISAVHAKDAKAAAGAIKSAFELCDAAPHVEGEHIEGEE